MYYCSLLNDAFLLHRYDSSKPIRQYGKIETTAGLRKNIAENIHHDFNLESFLDESKEEWEHRMSRPREYCDQVFLNLASNYVERDIFIFPVVPDQNPIHFSPENPKGNPYYLLYYPEGPNYFGEGAHYQSLFPNPKSQDSESDSSSSESE